MIPTRATEWFLFAVAVACALWEIAVLRWGEPGSTISEVMQATGRRNPEVILFAGMLLAHWFWSAR